MQQTEVAESFRAIRFACCQFAIGPDKRCQLNRSMQHHLISWSDNTSSRETICKAVLNQNLNRAVFCLNQRP
jgi:hypothetical protein